jgi:hypothetical protein
MLSLPESERRNFYHSPITGVSGPLADLLAVVKTSRTHPSAVLPKPFPIPVKQSSKHFTLRPDCAVFMPVNTVFLLLRFPGGHSFVISVALNLRAIGGLTTL